jgi:hypothetical protein
MAKLLLEDTWVFRPDRKNIRVEESQGGVLKSHIIPGVLSKCDEVNGNKRRYPRPVWEANVKEDSKLMAMIKRRAAFGLLEHPESGVVDLRSNISHAVTGVKLEEDGTLRGEITILDGEGFPDGKKLRGLIEFGYDPLVSSRGYGTVVRVEDGIDEVQNDYVCEGWDVVSAPSFEKAQLTPDREITTRTERQISAPNRQGVVVENKETAIAPQPQHQASTALIPTKNIMDLNQIRSAVQALRSVDILTASSRVVAESFSQATALHRQLSEFQATAPTTSWDCTTLHEEINTIEKAWTGSIQSIREENTRLKADREKLVVVAENMAKTARLYRTQLSETVQKRNAASKLYEQVAQRGRGWQKIAVHRGQKAVDLEHQAKVACAAIDMLAEQLVKVENGDDRTTTVAMAMDALAEQYHIDTTKLARTIAELKFPQEVAKPEITEKLNKARTADEVLAVIAEMEKAANPTPPVPPDNGAPAPVQESQKSPTTSTTTPAIAAPGAAASAESQDVTVQLGEALGHQLSFEQAVSITRRLSGAKSTKVQEAAPAK